jgi:hypothetical protein
MSRKYIRQLINRDFVYPNNEVSEYDVEIVQDLNSNSVSGTISAISVVSAATTGITLAHNYTWASNGAETWVRNSNSLGIFSVHAMVPNQLYYKPWRVVDTLTFSPPFLPTYSGSNIISIFPSNFGLTSFTNGTYYFEIRFIGHLSVYPICFQVTISSL